MQLTQGPSQENQTNNVTKVIMSDSGGGNRKCKLCLYAKTLRTTKTDYQQQHTNHIIKTTVIREKL